MRLSITDFVPKILASSLTSHLQPANTMAKRKRTSLSPAPNDSPESADRVLKNQKRLCLNRINAAQEPLIAALRLGAGFERQKHSRRKKTAQSKGDDKGLARLEAEYAVLKSLNIEQVADQHLRKTVGKVKSLKEHEALKEYIEGVRKGSGDPSTLNVLARLYKVAAVKKAIDDAVDDLKGIVGGAETQNTSKKDAKKAKKSQQLDDDEEMLDVSDDENDPYSMFNARIAAPSSGGEESEDSISDDERPPSIGDSESEHDPEDDLADSESEEDSFQGFSGEDASDDEDIHLDRRIAVSSDHSDLDSEMESESDEIIKTKTKSSKESKSADAISSAFLPALNHANYLPGSESEASDLDEAPRKNRRGQRARQKIAELKYGAKAKHLEKQSRNQGWDAKRGAVSDDRRGKGSKSGRGPQQSGGNAEPLGDKKKKNGGVKRDDKGELHPSWQAAKLAKEKKQIKIDLRAPQGQGKKVVFD